MVNRITLPSFYVYVFILCFLLGNVIGLQLISKMTYWIYWLFLFGCGIGLMIKMNFFSKNKQILFTKKHSLSFAIILLATVTVAQLSAKRTLQQAISDKITHSGTATVQGYLTNLSEGVLSSPKVLIHITDATQSTTTMKPKNKHTSHLIDKDLLIKINNDFSVQPSSQIIHPFKIGQMYEFTIEYRPIHSIASFGVFDSEQWLLMRGIDGEGKLLSAKALHQPVPLSMVAKIPLQVEVLRLQTRNWFVTRYQQENDKTKQQAIAVALSLLSGDKLLIDKATKNDYQHLGLLHVLAISGPHVWLAGFGFVLLFTWCINANPTIFLKIPRPYFLVIAWTVFSLFYTLFSGFEVPALRTALMLIIFYGCRSLGIVVSPWLILLCTSALLVLLNPLLLMSSSYILSFGAVFLVMLLAYWLPMPSFTWQQFIQQNHTKSKIVWLKQWLFWIIKIQFLLSLLLLPLTCWIFGESSLISLIGNLLIVPILSFIVVPLLLIGFFISLVSLSIGSLLFELAISVISSCHDLIDGLLKVFPINLWQQQFNFIDIVICYVLIASFIGLYKHRSIFYKQHRTIMLVTTISIIATILYTITHLPLLNSYPLAIYVLDVGQGLGTIIQTKHHTFIYDTGKASPDDAYSIGDQVLRPMLNTLNVKKIDALILSHLDNDHSGGAKAILEQFKVKQIISSRPYHNSTNAGKIRSYKTTACHTGQRFTIDEVTFEFLSPSQAMTYTDENEASCILKISFQTFSMLLTGDAGIPTEQNLLKDNILKQKLKSEVLILGHHGSKHSSSIEFLQAVAPKRAVVSAGFANRYGHPHASVLEAVSQQHIMIDSTITQGTLSYVVQSDGSYHVKGYRQHKAWLAQGLKE